jgi:N-methylhydantoinase A/oxoprolinase/acetone carboxylase beta subunit
VRMSRAAPAGGIHRWLVGVDIGGTFTDIVASDQIGGEERSAKVLTTPRDPLVGVTTGLKVLFHDGHVRIEDCESVIHATTLAINTLIEQTGARVAMVTTAGFRDVIETGQEDRYDLYDLQFAARTALVPRRWRIGVSERMNARGEVVEKLNRESLLGAIERLGDREAVAVCFLHSWANDAHEHEAGETISAMLPNAYLCLSSEVAPIVREYERFTATAINAYVGPRVSTYLGELRSSLVGQGFAGPVGIMKSDGGMCMPDEAARHPVRILESGPAAGVLAAASVARESDEAIVVALDMGGTTAKACLIADGQPTLTDELSVARLRRFAKGSGLPVRLPSVDLLEIGAGGGSIAWIDALGLLQVGPESAGAQPGPACYGLGGESPTVTDADLILGYIDGAAFAGGALKLEPRLAEEAIEAHILRPTGTQDPIMAAWGIYDVVNESMTRAVRLHCLEHGIDPALVTLIATGGAGPVHASAILAKLGARRLICPRGAGVASAKGLLLAPWTVDHSVAELVAFEDLSDSAIAQRMRQLEMDARSRTEASGLAFSATGLVDVQVRGQAYAVELEVKEGASVGDLEAAFRKEYERRFGRPPWGARLEVVQWRVRLSHERGREQRNPTDEVISTRASKRPAYFGPDWQWVETSVVGRSSLRAGMTRQGPLLVEDGGSTVVVGPEQRMEVTANEALTIERSDQRRTGGAL